MGCRRGLGTGTAKLSAAYAKDFGKIVDGYADGLPQSGKGAREKAEAYTRKKSPLGYYLQAGRAGLREAFAECFGARNR